jgi:hypothetical protein
MQIPEPRLRTLPRACIICETPIAESMGSVLPRDVVKMFDGAWDPAFWPRELCNTRLACQAVWRRMLLLEAGNSGDFSIGSDVWPGAAKLLEEMGELTQALGKLIATAGRTDHWDGSDLRVRLIEEMADVRAALAFFQGKNFTAADDDRIANRYAEKSRLFHEWDAAQRPGLTPRPPDR